ncbi:hypothetical protein [Portibacter marinus]|uniref:hypothetical protein n=1 Tax=Portibacter marinus TaxID=2898660 RepID=UPI001F265EFA|nr:hypothetical protein [Portibacter marinus]
MKHIPIDFDTKRITKIDLLDNEKCEVFLSNLKTPLIIDKYDLEALLSPKEIYYFF